MKINFKALFITSLIIMILSVSMLEAKAKKTQKLKGRAPGWARQARIEDQEGRYQRAIDYYLQILAQTPDHVESSFKAAEAYYKLAKQDIDEVAVELYSKSFAQFSKTIEMIHAIPDWKSYRDFEDWLQRSDLMIQHTYNEIFKLAQAMSSEGEIEMAKEFFEALVKLDPKRPEAYGALVAIAQRENDSERKMELYHQLLAVSGNEPRILFNIALEHRNSEEWDDAKEFYLLYINAAPESVSGYRGLAFVNTALEKYDEAIAAYERAHLLEPENIDILMNMSDIFATMNNNEAAISVFKKVVALEDKFEDQEDLIITVRNLCTLLVRDQKWAEALTYAKIWYRLEPDSQASVNYVIYLARQARDTATQREFEEKLKKF